MNVTLKYLLGMVALCLGVVSARAAAPAFGDFNQNQFSITGNKITIKDGAKVTNITGVAKQLVSTNYYFSSTNFYVDNTYVSNYFVTNVFNDTYASNYFTTNLYQLFSETNFYLTNLVFNDTYISNFYVTNIVVNDTYVSNYYATNLFLGTNYYVTNAVQGAYIANLNGTGTNTVMLGTRLGGSPIATNLDVEGYLNLGHTNRFTDDGTQLLRDGLPITSTTIQNITTNFLFFSTNFFINNSYVSNYFVTNVFNNTTASNYFVTNIYQFPTTTNFYITNIINNDNLYISNFYQTNLIVNDTFVSNYFTTNLFWSTNVYITNALQGGYIASQNGRGTNTLLVDAVLNNPQVVGPLTVSDTNVAGIILTGSNNVSEISWQLAASARGTNYFRIDWGAGGVGNTFSVHSVTTLGPTNFFVLTNGTAAGTNEGTINYFFSSNIFTKPVTIQTNLTVNTVIVTNLYGSTTYIASNASSAQIDFSPGNGTTHYTVTNLANALTLQLTNLYLDTFGPRDAWIYIETDGNSRTVTVSTNGITTGTRISWGFNSTTNGATSFTVTNRARLNLVRNRAGVISAAYEHQQ